MTSQDEIQLDAMLEMLSYTKIMKKVKKILLKNQKYVKFYMNWTLTFFTGRKAGGACGA